MLQGPKNNGHASKCELVSFNASHNDIEYLLMCLSFHHRMTCASCRDDDEDQLILNIKRHYSQAIVASVVFSLGDCAYIKVSTCPKYFSTYMC